MSLLDLFSNALGTSEPAPPPPVPVAKPLSDSPSHRTQTYQPKGAFNAKQYRFTFEFCPQDDGVVRTYILSMPSYGFWRSEGAHETHRYYDRRRKLHYICYDPMPTSQADALRIAAMWAENTLQYIHYGTAF